MAFVFVVRQRNYCETNFNPTIEVIRVTIKNNLQKSAGSLKNIMPTIAVPTAPIPVHTAYAVPIGKVCVALYNNNMLSVRLIKKPITHIVDIIPLVIFALPRQVVKPISNRPAIISIIQFIIKLFDCCFK